MLAPEKGADAAAVDAKGRDAVDCLLAPSEGDDKVAKYPTLFQAADVVLLSKIDLAAVMDFDEQRMRDDLAQVNSRAPLLRISTRSGAGLQAWLDWVQAIDQFRWSAHVELAARFVLTKA